MAGDSKLTLDLQNDRQRVLYDGELVGRDLSAIFIRNLGLDARSSRYSDELGEDAFALLNKLEEYQGLVLSSLEILEGREDVLVVNPTSTLTTRRATPTQFATLTDHDVPVPDTVTTNDPKAVREFVDEHGAAIFKPISGGGHARLLNANELEEKSLEMLAESPVQFQQYVNGDSLRLYVIGGEVVAAGRILTEEIDYRTSEHDVEKIDPREALTDAAIRSAWALGLTFAAVEIIDTGDEFRGTRCQSFADVLGLRRARGHECRRQPGPISGIEAVRARPGCHVNLIQAITNASRQAAGCRVERDR